MPATFCGVSGGQTLGRDHFGPDGTGQVEEDARLLRLVANIFRDYKSFEPSPAPPSNNQAYDIAAPIMVPPFGR